MARVYIWFASFVLVLVGITGFHSGVFVPAGVWSHNITINCQDGNDSRACLDNSSVRCRTLDFVLNNLNRNSTLILMEQPGNVSCILNENHTLERYRDIAIVGRSLGDANLTEIVCGSDVGLSFRFCEGITFQLLRFSNCGRPHKSVPFGTRNAPNAFYAGIFFEYCTDFTMVNCSIFGSPGKGLVLNNVGGTVNISGSIFERNTAAENESNSWITSTGGGVSIHIGMPSPINATHHIQPQKYHVDTKYYITDSIFRANCYADNVNDTNQHVDQGGGMSVLFHGLSQNNSISIDGCHFLSNSALWGAGILSTFYDNAQGNLLEVKSCLFQGNKAKFAGGGIRTGSEFTGRKQLLGNRIRFEQVQFIENSAIVGGGLSHYGWPYTPITTTDIQRGPVLNGCGFYGNKATMGSAMGVVLNDNEFGIGPALPFRVTIEDSFFDSNSIIRSEDQVVTGQGALYSSSAPIVLKNITFIKNSKTALLLDNADVKIQGLVVFAKNNGTNGGAVALFGKARIVTTNGAQLVFENNRAEKKGGAIYVRAPGPPVAAFRTRELDRHQCFLAYENSAGLFVDTENVESWNTKLNFTGNSAARPGGDSIYATTLQSCFRRGEERLNNKALDWENITFYTAIISKEISTDPVAITINKNEWHVAASEVFDATVTLLDEKGNAVYGVVQIDIHPEVAFDLPSNLFLVNDDVQVHGSDSKVRNLKLKGKGGTEFSITIHNLEGQTISNKSQQLTLKDCNPGFRPTNSMRCDCKNASSDDCMEGMSHCDRDGKTFYLKTGYWGGYVNKRFATINCPTDYCSKQTQHYSQRYYKYDLSPLCTTNRSPNSTLCGKCKTHYTVNIGNEYCTLNSECSKSRLYWQIPLFILVIVVLILIVLGINIDIFTSYLNSWLYFYQVITLLTKGASLGPGMNQIIKFVNLQTPGAETCVFQNVDNLQKAGVNYVIPASFLVCLIIISQIARLQCCRNCCSCCVNNNVSRAICTILVLSYTNVTMISFRLIHALPVSSIWILYIQGDIDLTEPWSPTLVVLFIVAVVTLVFFVLLFPLLLVFRVIYLPNWCDHIIDIFRDCYRDGLGPFAAYYFICRIALLIADLFIFPGPFKRCILMLLTLFTLQVFMLFKPYRAANEHNDHNYRWLNHVDAVFLTNLCVITILASSETSDATRLTRDGIWVCIIILAWLPMLYFLGLCFYAIWVYRQRLLRCLRVNRQRLLRCLGRGNASEEGNAREVESLSSPTDHLNTPAQQRSASSMTSSKSLTKSI